MTGCRCGPMETSWGRLLDGDPVCTMPSGTATVHRSRDTVLLAQPAHPPAVFCSPHAGASAAASALPSPPLVAGETKALREDLSQGWGWEPDYWP